MKAHPSSRPSPLRSYASFSSRPVSARYVGVTRPWAAAGPGLVVQPTASDAAVASTASGAELNNLLRNFDEPNTGLVVLRPVTHVARKRHFGAASCSYRRMCV